MSRPGTKLSVNGSWRNFAHLIHFMSGRCMQSFIKIGQVLLVLALRIDPKFSQKVKNKTCGRSFWRNHRTDFGHFGPTTIIWVEDNAADGILKYSNFFEYLVWKRLDFLLFFRWKFRPAQFQPNGTSEMHQNVDLACTSDGDDARILKMPILFPEIRHIGCVACLIPKILKSCVQGFWLHQWTSVNQNW